MTSTPPHDAHRSSHARRSPPPWWPAPPRPPWPRATTTVRRGSCSGSTDWKIKAGPEDGRIEVEAEVDSNRTGQTWRWRLRAQRQRVRAGAPRTTEGPSGSFEVAPAAWSTAAAPTLRVPGRATRAPARCAAEPSTSDRCRPHTAPYSAPPTMPEEAVRALRQEPGGRSSWPPGSSCSSSWCSGTVQLSRRAADARGGRRRPGDHRAARPLGRRAGDPARAGRRRPRGGRPVRPDRARPAARRRRAADQDLDARDGTDRLLRRDPADRRAVPARRRTSVDVLARAARTDAEVSDLSRAGEPVRARGGGAARGLHPDRSPEGEPLLFEAYYSAADIAARSASRCYDAVPADHPRRRCSSWSRSPPRCCGR